MFEVHRNNISITRGDSGFFDLSITDKLGNPYALKDTDEVVFTVKEDTKDRGILIQKTISNGTVVITPEDTEGMCYGTYVYDVQLKTADGYVDTIITPHRFKVLEEVTF